MSSLSEVALATRAGRTSRAAVASRLGSSEPEATDLRGEGAVDFESDRVWITDSLITKRIVSDGDAGSGRLIRLVNRGMYAALDRVVGRDAFYEGGARWRQTARGWRGPSGQIDAAKDTWHPLFLLDVFAGLYTELEDGEDGRIRDTAIETYRVSLYPDMFDSAAWDSLAQIEPGPERGRRSQNALRQVVGAVVSVDARARIRRMGFEAVGNADGNALWLFTELWDFGTKLGHHRPVDESI